MVESSAAGLTARRIAVAFITVWVMLFLCLSCSEHISSIENETFRINVSYHVGYLSANSIMLTGSKKIPGASDKTFRLLEVRQAHKAEVKFISASVLAIYTRWVDSWKRPFYLNIANANSPPDRLPVVNELDQGSDTSYSMHVKGDEYFLTISNNRSNPDLTCIDVWRYEKDYYGDHVRQAGIMLINVHSINAAFVSDSILSMDIDWPDGTSDTVLAYLGALPDSSMGLSMSKEELLMEIRQER